MTPGALEDIARTARVARVAGLLRQARFGVIGTPCPGMLDVEADDSDFEKALGVTTVRFDLDTLLAAADTASPSESARAADRLVVGGCMPGNMNSVRRHAWYDRRRPAGGHRRFRA